MCRWLHILLSHRSEPCVVHNATFSEEGRYGCALFIKPPVMKSNSKLWAEFDNLLQRRQLERAAVYNQIKVQKQAQQQEQEDLLNNDLQQDNNCGASVWLMDQKAQQHSRQGLSSIDGSLDEVEVTNEEQTDDVVLFGTLQHVTGVSSESIAAVEGKDLHGPRRDSVLGLVAR